MQAAALEGDQVLMLENGSAGGDEEGEEEALARELDAALGTNDLASLQQVASSASVSRHLGQSVRSNAYSWLHALFTSPRQSEIGARPAWHCIDLSGQRLTSCCA